jgi:hypothetical protein
MCTTIQKFANNGIVNISTANNNLDGSGVLGTVYVAASAPSNGAIISSVTVKATGVTTEGTVRLFIYDGTNYFLWKEIAIPANAVSSVTASFQTTIYDDLTLNPSQVLLASTQNAESFNVFANGSDFNNCTCTSDCSCNEPQIVANTGLVNIATANPNRNGSGTIGTLITAPTGALVNCTQILKITIKATASNDQGLIGIYIYDGTTYFLISEIPVQATTQTNVQKAYGMITVINKINLKAGYSIGVSTQRANSFNIITFASDVTNCECPE